MTTRQRRRERGHVAELARNGAHLAALSALAFQQPILDILGKNPAFFAVRGSSSTETVLFALALTIAPPAVLLARSSARRSSPPSSPSGVPPRENDVAIYAVAGNVLEELPGSDRTYALDSRSLAASDGATVPIRNAIKGEARGTRSPTGATLAGWAANMKGSRPADSVVVLLDGKSVFTGRPGNITCKDILERVGVDNAGFIFRLPGSLLPAAGKDHSVRVFRLSGSAATELRYPPGYPWATG